MNDLIRRLLSLLDGVEGTYTCRCGRGLKVGVSGELWQAKLQLERLLGEPVTATPEERSRFSLLEVDE